METKFHAETIDLPSKGHFYDEDSPLSTGQLDIKYMTAEHEDILTSRNLISKGLVIHKFLEALIATPGVKYEDLLLGDKSAVILASRILGYGKDYPAKVNCPSCGIEQEEIIDLIKIPDKELDLSDHPKGKNLFEFVLPNSKQKIVFRLLTVKDELDIDKELQGYRKINKDISTEVTTRLKKCILSIDGETDRAKISSMVKSMRALDSKAFRNYVRDVTPDIDLSIDFVCQNCQYSERVEVGIDANFFWPDAQL